MKMSRELLPFSLDRMERAVEKVRERLQRVVAALESAGIPYAVVGGQAVAAWVSRVDEAAVRNTRDVDLLVRRSDWGRLVKTLELAGFMYRRVAGVDGFLDGPEGKMRDGVHVVFAAEKVRPEEPLANPDVADSVHTGEFRVVALDALVRIKLTAFRDKDRTHLRDLIEIGLIDASWIAKFPPALADRLQHLLDTPNG
jgi:hypothetical protein